MRILVEGYALRHAVPNLDSASMDSIRVIHKKMLSVGRRDAPAYSELHHSLHFSLYEPCESPWAMHTIATLWLHTERHRRLAFRIPDFATDLTKDYHSDIIECVAVGDADGAVEALRLDLLRTSELVIAAYATQ